MYKVGQLVWLYKSDLSGLLDHPPVLILNRYTDIPKAFLYNSAANKIMVGTEEKTVYDILCDGVIETAVDEDWLTLDNRKSQ